MGKRRLQIAVFGSSEDLDIDTEMLNLAKEVGEEVARIGAVLFSGGMGGIMRAAAQGAKKRGGITIGVLPHSNPEEASEFNDVVVCSGLGWGMQSGLIVRSCDGVIVIGGGCGTLNELALAYMHNKPIVALALADGWASRFVDSYLDERRIVKVHGAKSAFEAVRLLTRLVTKKR